MELTTAQTDIKRDLAIPQMTWVERETDAEAHMVRMNQATTIYDKQLSKIAIKCLLDENQIFYKSHFYGFDQY
jgi:hypothetical protein